MQRDGKNCGEIPKKDTVTIEFTQREINDLAEFLDGLDADEILDSSDATDAAVRKIFEHYSPEEDEGRWTLMPAALFTPSMVEELIAAGLAKPVTIFRGRTS